MPNNFRHELLKDRRDHLQLTRLDVIKRLYETGLDISEGALRSWEEGESAPDADKLPFLATVLKCKVHEFYS
mgnify:CR=1 FL=1